MLDGKFLKDGTVKPSKFDTAGYVPSAAGDLTTISYINSKIGNLRIAGGAVNAGVNSWSTLDPYPSNTTIGDAAGQNFGAPILTVSITEDIGSGDAKITTNRPHGLVNGDEVEVSDSAFYDGQWPITVINATSFILNGMAYDSDELATAKYRIIIRNTTFEPENSVIIGNQSRPDLFLNGGYSTVIGDVGFALENLTLDTGFPELMSGEILIGSPGFDTSSGLIWFTPRNLSETYTGFGHWRFYGKIAPVLYNVGGVHSALNAGVATADPTIDVENGDLYYNTTTHKFVGRVNGAWTDFSTGGGGGHVIENSGTPLTARANLNFTSGLYASDETPDTVVRLGGVATENIVITGDSNTHSLTLLDFDAVQFSSNTFGISNSAIDRFTIDSTVTRLKNITNTDAILIDNENTTIYGGPTTNAYVNVYSTPPNDRGVIASVSNGAFSSTIELFADNTTSYITVSGGTGFAGIQYGVDYSANFTARSLVDKAYVDLVAGGGHTIQNNGTPLTARANLNIKNGLTAVDDAGNNASIAKLGGALTEHTAILAGSISGPYGPEPTQFNIAANGTPMGSSWFYFDGLGITLDGAIQNNFTIFTPTTNTASQINIQSNNKTEIRMVQNAGTYGTNGVDRRITLESGGAVSSHHHINDATTVQRNIMFYRTWTGSVAAGVGLSLDFLLGTSGSVVAKGIQYKLTDVTASSHNSKFTFAVLANHVATDIADLDEFGWRYLADYSANYTDRSLVDRGFVNGAYWKLTGTSTLTGDVTISGADIRSLSLGGSGAAELFDFFVNTNDAINLRSVLTGDTGGVDVVPGQVQIFADDGVTVLMLDINKTTGLKYTIGGSDNVAIDLTGNINITAPTVNATLTGDSAWDLGTAGSFIMANTGTGGGNVYIATYGLELTSPTQAGLYITGVGIEGYAYGATHVLFSAGDTAADIIKFTATAGTTPTFIVEAGASVTTFAGVRYDRDYSANYTDRSFVDRGYVLSAKTYAAKQTFSASTSGNASINIPHGAVPSSPNDGDIWTSTLGIFARINGVTYDLASGSGDMILSAAQTSTGKKTFSLTDAGTNTVLYPVKLNRESSNTPATGIGVGLEFEVETASANLEIGGAIEAVTTNVGSGTEAFDLVFKLMAAGAAAAEVARLTSYKSLKFTAVTSDSGSVADGDIWYNSTAAKFKVRQGGVTRNVIPALTKSIVLFNPSATENVTIFFTEVAITITEINDSIQGTSPSVTYQIRHATTRNSGSPNNLFSAGRTLTSSSGSSTTTFNDATIPADSWVWLETSAASGTIADTAIVISYVED